MKLSSFYIGVDVGTGSARAGLFDASGNMIATDSTDIAIWKPEIDFAEQSSTNIWNACIKSIRTVLKMSGVAPEQVGGLGFDATCSLVVLGKGGRPVSVSPTGKNEQNVIMWMDHRAVEQAKRINAQHHKVLQFVGGQISPEMQAPKLLWLKEHLPSNYRTATRFFDLPDFLTFQATGTDQRSLCSTVCKWTYLGHEKDDAGNMGRWEPSFFRQIGLEDLVDEKFARIGTSIRPMGEPVGNGLTPSAAESLGLMPGTPVGTSIIDAHAGGIGMLGASVDGSAFTPQTVSQRLALIGGTSSCHMALSQKPVYIPGVWGPYYSAMVPDFWLSEGGQSATGALVDHVIFSHPAADRLKQEAQATNTSVYDCLNDRLEKIGKGKERVALLTEDLHVLPYFHGNRSPRANPGLTGMICGLKLAHGIDDLARLYLATVQAIAHGTRHIIAQMNAFGFQLETIFACGGGTKNPLFLQQHADITGCRVVLPKEPEAVLLGAAILGAVASKDFPSVPEAMRHMNRSLRIIQPVKGEIAHFHARKHAVFHRMYHDQLTYGRMIHEEV